MISLKIRPAINNDISSIVDIRLRTVTEEDISEFGVPEDNLFTSTDNLKEMWANHNLLKDGCEVFVAENRGKVIGFIVFNMKGSDNIDNVIVAKKDQKKGLEELLLSMWKD